MPEAMLPRSSFALYAELGVTIGADCHVIGDVGVRSRAADVVGWQLALETGAELAPQHRVVAPSVRIDPAAQCPDALADRLQGQLSGGATAAPFPYEQMPPLPLAPAPSPGRPSVSVPAGQHQDLGPGDYDDLRLDGSATLAAGDYSFARVTLGADASLSAAGPVRVAVLHSLTAGAGARLRPESEDVTAGGLVVSVAGTDREGAAAVSLAERTDLRAVLIAPHATVKIAERAAVTGAVAGFLIDLEAHVRVRHQDGLPDVPGDARGSQAMPPGYGVPAGSLTEPVAGPVPSGRRVGVCLGLPASNGDQLQEFLRQVSNPHSPQYRQFLTQEQFCAAYAAPAEDYADVQAWADRAGLVTLGTVESNLLLAVGGTAEQIQRALFVNLVLRQRPDGSTYPAADRALSLDVRPRLLHISGIGEHEPMRALNADGSGLDGSYTGPDLRRAYLGTPNSVFHQLDGTGQVIGIPDWAEYVDTDVDNYEASVRFNQGTPAVPQPPTISIEIVEADSDTWFTPDPPTSSAVEAAVDVQLAYAMAPGAAIRFFKAGAGWSSTLDKCLHDMANFTPSLTVVSCSLGFVGTSNAQSALDHLAAKGCSFVTASGDDGCTAEASSSLLMNNQTLVGGTVLYCNFIPAGVAPASYPTPYYDHEGAWTKSGGGLLLEIDPGTGQLIANIPQYQIPTMDAAAAVNGGSTEYRNYPDVAMASTGVAYYRGKWGYVGGTSCATPLFAGFIALANQLSQNNKGPGKQGFLNPVLYEIGLTAGQPGGADLYSQCFNDISDGIANTGSGGSFSAVAGYDLVTGLGSPKPQLILQLGSSAPLSSATPLTNIRFIVTTGDDNLRDDSSALAYVYVDGLEMFTLTLKANNVPAWDNWSVHQLDFAVPPGIGPLTEARGIVGTRIELVQGDGWSETADNWDIKALQVSLYSPGTSQVCQLNLVGDNKLQDGSHGLVRLSATPGSHGSGPWSPIYLTGPGSGC